MNPRMLLCSSYAVYMSRNFILKGRKMCSSFASVCFSKFSGVARRVLCNDITNTDWLRQSLFGGGPDVSVCPSLTRFPKLSVQSKSEFSD